jgi:hypothetical protein
MYRATWVRQMLTLLARGAYARLGATADYDTKSGKRCEMIAWLCSNTACELGFRGSLDEWERFMGAVVRQ